MSLSFLVSTKKDNKQIVIDFKDIFNIKSDLRTMTLLWNTNSYHVNLVGRFFIVNGGRKINIGGFDTVKCIEIIYAKRHSMAVSFNTSDKNGKGNIQKETITYLLGMQGKDIKGTKREIMLHVSTNGDEHEWLDKR